MELSGSLLDDQQLNDAIKTTVHNVLGYVNSMSNRMREVSTNCANSSHRVDTILADVSGLKTEKAVVHTIVKCAPKDEVKSVKTTGNTTDLYLAKMAEMDGKIQDHTYNHKLSMIHYQMQNCILPDDENETTSLLAEPNAQQQLENIVSEPEVVTEDLDASPEEHESSKEVSDVENGSESPKVENNGFSDIRKELAARFASPKHVPSNIQFSEDSESDNESLQKANAQNTIVESCAKKPLNGTSGVLDQVSAKPVAIMKSIFSDDSASDTEPPFVPKIKPNVSNGQTPSSLSLDKTLDCTTVLAKESANSSGIQQVALEKSLVANDSDCVKAEQKQTPAVNGFSNIQAELSARFARQESALRTSSSFDDSHEENKTSSKLDVEEISKVQSVTSHIASPILNANKKSFEKLEQKPVTEKQISVGKEEHVASISNGTAAQVKTQKTEPSAAKKPAPKKFSLLDDSDSDDDLFSKSAPSKNNNKIDVKKPINNATVKPAVVAKPVKSLLDSDTDEDPEALFQTKTTAKVVKEDVTPAKDVQASVVKSVEVTKEKAPAKKVVSKSIFFDSDDSDDELFKPKTVKQESKAAEVPASNMNEKMISDGPIKKSEFIANLNSVIAKKATPDNTKKATPENNADAVDIKPADSLNAILKSRPRAPPTRRSRGSQPPKNMPSTATTDAEPIFDPLS